jgi:hypothetical protein
MSEPLTNEEEVTRATNLAAGVAKRFSGMTSVMFDNSAETPAEIEDKLKGFVRDRTAVLVSKAAYEAAVAKANASQAVIVPYMGKLTDYVRAIFGNATEILVDFGIAPLKARTPMTAEAKVAANAKREATRKARGVMGPRERLQVRGDVTGVDITPVIEPAPEPAPAAQPSKAATAEPAK